MARNVEREIEALMAAKTEQIPRWPGFLEHREHELSMADHIQLLHGLLGVHAELIVRLAQEIDILGGT